MTLYQLKAFVTVAKHKSFTLAAEALRVRQPSVSLIIQGLQRELDVKLFERLGNKIRLTTAGEELLSEAEPIVARAEKIKERMDEVKGLRKGKLAVGGSAIAGASFLPVAVQMFKNQHPGVEVTLRIQSSKKLEQRLLDGEIDIAITGRAPLSSLVVAEPYREEEVVAIAPQNHPLAKKRSVSLELLAKHPLVSHEKDNLIRGLVEESFGKKKLVFAPILEVEVHGGGRDAIKSAVASGLGIGFISKSYVISDIKGGRLRLLKIPELNLKRTLYIAFHRNRRNSYLVQAFVEFLKQNKDHLRRLSQR